MDIIEELYTLAFGLAPYNTYFPCVAAAGKLYAQMQPSGAEPAVITWAFGWFCIEKGLSWGMDPKQG